MISRTNTEVSLWSARFTTAQPHAWENTLQDIVQNHSGLKYFGFVSNQDHSYTFTRYPREKYGIPTTEELERALVLLQMSLLRLAIQHKDMLEHYGYLQNGYDHRIVLGRHLGYSDQVVIDLEQIQRALPKSSVEEGKVLSVYRQDQDIITYGEPAAVIWTTENELPLVSQLAYDLQQERYTVENFRHNVSTLVEIIR